MDTKPFVSGRWDHSQTGLTTCGGEDREGLRRSNKWTCLSIANGSWHLSHHLITPRWRHTAWSSREGILLIGGSSTTSYGTNAPSTADKLTDGKSEKHKDFAAPPLGSCIIHISDNKILLINDKTSIFNSSGFVQALTGLHPDFPRQQYGCGYYKNSENKEVSFFGCESSPISRNLRCPCVR